MLEGIGMLTIVALGIGAILAIIWFVCDYYELRGNYQRLRDRQHEDYFKLLDMFNKLHVRVYDVERAQKGEK